MITLKVNVRICFDSPAFSENADLENKKLQISNIEKDIKRQFSDVEIIRQVTEEETLKIKGYAYEAEVSHNNNSLMPKNGFSMCFLMKV